MLIKTSKCDVCIVLKLIFLKSKDNVNRLELNI